MTISKPFKGLAVGQKQHENANHYTRVFYGDTNLCEQWITYAQNILQQMILRPGTQSRRVMATPDVEVYVTCRPNRIEIKAGGPIHVTIANAESIDGDYPDNTLSPYQKQKYRLLYEKSIISRSKPDHYAGDRYWYNQSLSDAISWKKGTLYYHGLFYTISESRYKILCACLYHKPTQTGGNYIQVVTYDSESFTANEIRLTSYKIKISSIGIVLTPVGSSQLISLPNSNSSTLMEGAMFNEIGDTIIFQGSVDISGVVNFVISKVLINSDSSTLNAIELYTMPSNVTTIHRTFERIVVASGYSYFIPDGPMSGIFVHGGTQSELSSDNLQSVTGVGDFLTGGFVGNKFYYLYVEKYLTSYIRSTSDYIICDVLSDSSAYTGSTEFSSSLEIYEKVSIKEGYIDLDNDTNTLNVRTLFTEEFLQRGRINSSSSSVSAGSGYFNFSVISADDDTTNILSLDIIMYIPKYNICAFSKSYTNTNIIISGSYTELGGEVTTDTNISSDYSVILTNNIGSSVIITDNVLNNYSNTSTGPFNLYIGGINGVSSSSESDIVADIVTDVTFIKRFAENNKIIIFHNFPIVSGLSYYVVFVIINLNGDVLELTNYPEDDFSNELKNLPVSVTKLR